DPGSRSAWCRSRRSNSRPACCWSTYPRCTGSDAQGTSSRTDRRPGAGKQIVDHMPVHVRQAEAAALEEVGEAGVVDPQEMEDGRLEVVDVHWPRCELAFRRGA